jgi:TolB-like protein/tetratricopeptide (TPR) repeat protein
VHHDEPSAADIHAELALILAGAGFVRNARMSRFLTFLIDRHLEGRHEELKESLIAHEVFGRRPDYDPKQDSIVRTEAARLRGRLAEHYAGAGRHSSVIVEIPKGGYVPLFRYREVPAGAAARPAAGRPAQSYGRLVAVLCAAIVLGGARWWSLHGQHTPIPIAVLPLTNLGHDSSGDPFADGLTGELVRNLSLIDGLAVRSRASSLLFTERSRDVREIGPRLGVDYLIDGSVLRISDALRFDVQLVRVRDGVPLWSGHFDRPIGDIFEVEDEIGLAIVNTLRLHLGRGRRRYETSVAAYDDYLRARAIRFGADHSRFVERIAGFERALGRDPTFAPAYAGLASTYAIESVQFPPEHRPDELAKLRAAADKALEIDPLLPEAYEALAMADARDARWHAAEQEFRHAIEMDPHDSRMRAEFAMWFLAVLGRSGEAIEQARRADVDDPLASDVQVASAWSLMEAGRYEEAETHCAKLPSNFRLRAQCLGRASLGQGRLREGIATLRASTEDYFNPQTLGFLGYALARAGQREEAQRMVEDPKGPNEEALIYAGLGDKERTIDALERMAARGPQRAGQYLYSPELSSLLAGDPRLPALRTKIGLPE